MVFGPEDKNAGRHLELFARLFPEEKSLRIIDYGSSWGYTTYQFKEAGHQVQGYEISRSRAGYGIKNLDVDICTDEKQLRKGNHIFFSSHVIEHHPDIASMIQSGQITISRWRLFYCIMSEWKSCVQEEKPGNISSFLG